MAKQTPTAFAKTLKSRRMVRNHKRFVTASFRVALAFGQTHHSLPTPPESRIPGIQNCISNGSKTAYILKNDPNSKLPQRCGPVYFIDYILTIFSDGSFTIDNEHGSAVEVYDLGPQPLCIDTACTVVPGV